MNFQDSQTKRADLSAPGSTRDRKAPPVTPLEARLLAVMAAARYHGTELDRDELRVPRGTQPSPASLVEWVRSSGLWARAIRMRWRHLIRMQSPERSSCCWTTAAPP